MPRIDRSVLLALLASGALWITGAAVGLRISLLVTVVAAIYVAASSVALASLTLRTGHTLVVAWAVAVALLSTIVWPFAGWASLLVGALFGSIMVGVWGATGIVMLQVFAGRSETGRPYETA